MGSRAASGVPYPRMALIGALIPMRARGATAGLGLPLWAILLVLGGLALLFVLLLFSGQRRRAETALFGDEGELSPRELRGYTLALIDAQRPGDAVPVVLAHLKALPADLHMRALLAALHAERGDHAAACAEFERTIAQIQRQTEPPGPGAPTFVAATYAKFAHALRALGRMGDALNMEREALRFDRTVANMPIEGVELHAEYVRSDELERQAYEDLPRWERDRALAVPFGMSDLTGATRFYGAAVAAHPSSARLRADLAQALHASGDHYGAERQFREALRLDPGDAWAHYTYGLMQWRLQRPAEAEQALSEALRIAPTQAGILCTRSVFYLRQNRLEEAERDAALAAQARPDVSTVAWLRGVVALRRERTEEAARAFAQAERLGATDLGFRLAYAAAREALNDGAGAAEQYRLALRLEPTYGPTRVAYATFLFRQGKLREAEAEAREALRLEGGQEAHALLARLLLLERRLDEVVHPLRIAMQLDPASAELKGLQAEWFVARRQPQQAEALTQSLLIAPEPPPAVALFARGAALLMLDRELEAGAALREAVTVDPALPERLLRQARALREGGWLLPALDIVGRALLLEPEWPEALTERDTLLELQRTRPAPRRRLTFGPRRA